MALDILRAPVEALLYFPSGSVLVSAGGNYIKVVLGVRVRVGVGLTFLLNKLYCFTPYTMALQPIMVANFEWKTAATLTPIVDDH